MLDRLHQDIRAYLEAIDIARTEPDALRRGEQPPLMLDAYPCVTGVHAWRLIHAYTRAGRAG